MNKEQNSEVWERLKQKRPLDDLGLPTKNGRIDLSGLVVPIPTEIKQISTAIADVSVVSGTQSIKGASWNALDFTRSRLNGILFFNCAISDCVFDECQCQHWGLWGTTVSETSFRGADLRHSALGGLMEDERNTFRRVDFSGADLRQTAFSSAVFERCLFNNSKLAKVDFQGSCFAHCSFVGELREVLFYRHGFESIHVPPNEMTMVDFSRAKLRFVEFRGLDLDSVRLPRDEEHIVIEDYRFTLERIIEALSSLEDLRSKKLAAYITFEMKWAGPNQSQGILNKNDIIEVAGEEGLNELVRLLRR